MTFDEAAKIWPPELLRWMMSSVIVDFIEINGRIVIERDSLLLKRIRESVGQANSRRFFQEVLKMEEVRRRLRVAVAMKKLSRSIGLGDMAAVKADLSSLKQAKADLEDHVRYKLEWFFKEKKVATAYFPEFYQEELQTQEREFQRLYNRYIGHFYTSLRMG